MYDGGVNGWLDRWTAEGIALFQSGTNRKMGRKTTKIFLSGKCVMQDTVSLNQTSTKCCLLAI